MNFDLENLIRPNVKELKPYTSAREEFAGAASVFLDANESPYSSDYNRYPDPLQKLLKQKIAKLKKINVNQIFLGNGSDEAIDLLLRAFCEPAFDEVLILQPTYGMYSISAQVNNVKVTNILLTEKFDIDLEKTLEAITDNTKLIFLCSPNNPTGNLLSVDKIITLLNSFQGLVIIDEAYIDFSANESFISKLNDYKNLIVLQTFSKAWALASIRLGICFASEEIIKVINKIKPPYNINGPTQSIALQQLHLTEELHLRITQIIEQRKFMIDRLSKSDKVIKVFPSDANFVLVKMKDSETIYRQFIDNGIVVRNRSNVILCNQCLRITIGTPQENQILLNAL